MANAGQWTGVGIVIALGVALGGYFYYDWTNGPSSGKEQTGGRKSRRNKSKQNNKTRNKKI